MIEIKYNNIYKLECEKEKDITLKKNIQNKNDNIKLLIELIKISPLKILNQELLNKESITLEDSLTVLHMSQYEQPWLLVLFILNKMKKS